MCCACCLSTAQAVTSQQTVLAVVTPCRGMLPTDMGGMFWLRGQIREVMESVWAVAEAFKPDLMLANQLAYGQVSRSGYWMKVRKLLQDLTGASNSSEAALGV